MNDMAIKNKPFKISVKLPEELNEECNRILECWNSKKIIKHKPTLSNLSRSIKSALETNAENEIIQAISNYATEIHDADYKPFPTYKTYVWSLPYFLLRGGNKPFLRYLPDGDKWINYCRHKGISIIDKNVCTELNTRKSVYPIKDENIENIYNSLITSFQEMPYNQYLQTGHWINFRDKAIVNAGGRCQICADNRHLHVHHRTYENRGKETFLDIVVLCNVCHRKIHSKNKGD